MVAMSAFPIYGALPVKRLVRVHACRRCGWSAHAAGLVDTE